MFVGRELLGNAAAGLAVPGEDGNQGCVLRYRVVMPGSASVQFFFVRWREFFSDVAVFAEYSQCYSAKLFCLFNLIPIVGALI